MFTRIEYLWCYFSFGTTNQSSYAKGFYFISSW